MAAAYTLFNNEEIHVEEPDMKKVPQIPDELADWMLEYARRSDTPNMMECVSEILCANVMEREHNELYSKIRAARCEKQNRSEKPTTMVQVGQGGINIQQAKID